jgi:phenylacetate-CoA ligase
LENKVFPIIRYKNGDTGRYSYKKECSCGLPYPLIDKIKGRVTDNIKTPSGVTVNGAYLTTIFDEHPDLVSGFQVIQNKDYSITINCVLAKDKFSNDLLFDKIKNMLVKKTRGEVPVQMIFVEGLTQDRGKLKFIISNL